MKDLRRQAPTPSSKQDIDAFLNQASRLPTPHAGGPGRLLFALDATASRQPTWDRASDIQAEMFMQTRDLGGLLVQLCHFGGFGNFHTGAWLNGTSALLDEMLQVRCLAGRTQIERVLAHALDEASRARLNAVIYIGDSMEEDPDRLTRLAGQLGLRGVPVFIFHEGADAAARTAFRAIAALSKGAYLPFDINSAAQLRELLGAVAVYAAGGRTALKDFSQRSSDTIKRLSRDLGGR